MALRFISGRARGWLAVTGLALLAGLSGWFMLRVQSSLRESTPQPDKVPSLFLDSFRATRMNENGVREYSIEAPRLVNLPGRQGTEVQQPNIIVFRPDGQTHDWLIRADSGWVSPDQQEIRLKEGVKLERLASADNPPIQITTSNVVVRPKQNLVETEETVRAETPGGVLTGKGLRGYIREQRVELLSEVRGHYAPPKP